MSKSKNTEAIERIDENVYYTTGGGGVLFQFSNGYDSSNFESGSALVVPNNIEGKSVMSWGLNNNMPESREELVENNPLIGTLMETKRDILCGSGLMPYVVELVKGADGTTKRVMHEVEMPTAGKGPTPQDVLDASGGELLPFLEGFGEQMLHGQEFAEFVTTKGGHIASFKTQKSRYIRAEMKTMDGRINNWFWCGDWQITHGNTTNLKKKVDPLTGVDLNIYTIPNYNRAWEKLPAKFIHRLSFALLDDGYYFTPSWQGSRDWAELMNIIPKFHQFNLKNGYTIRWHIKIPKDYFFNGDLDALTEEERKAAYDAEEAARKKFISKVNKYLAGLENAGRAIFTEYEINKAVGQAFPGITIEPLKVDLQDESLLKLFDKTNAATVASQSIHPTLANVDNGLGRAAGGSEILRAYQMYLITKAYVPREVSLEKWRLIHKINGWDNKVKWTFRDQTLTTLAENSNGMQSQQN